MLPKIEIKSANAINGFIVSNSFSGGLQIPIRKNHAKSSKVLEDFFCKFQTGLHTSLYMFLRRELCIERGNFASALGFFAVAPLPVLAVKVVSSTALEENSMSKITTCLWFDHGKAREAAEFYASVFPDSHVAAVHASPADNPSAKEGDELTVEFTVLGQSFLGLNGGPHFKPNMAVSFVVVTENQEDTDRYWDAIVGKGGEESQCGWCTDRWGFAWQITPRALIEAMTDPDRAAAKRAMEAMMTMKKIDIAKIEAARAGR